MLAAGVQANPWWSVQLPAALPVVSVSIQTSSECACVADLIGARILVGTAPWTGPASIGNYTLCARVKGIVRGQRKAFLCDLSSSSSSAPVGQYIVIWRTTSPTGRKQLTLCEVDALLGGDVALDSLASTASQPPPPPAHHKKKKRKHKRAPSPPPPATLLQRRSSRRMQEAAAGQRQLRD